MYSLIGRRGEAWTATNSLRPHAHRQVAEKPPPIRPADGIGIVLELLPRPVARRLRAAVEVERLVEDGEVVVAHQRRRWQRWRTRSRHSIGFGP